MFGNRALDRSLSPFAPEMRLLLACARKRLRPGEAERIAELCHEPFNWQRFLALVDRHRVAPLVRQSLECVDAAQLPSQIRADLHRRVEQNLRLALAQATELIWLVRRFERAAIAVMSLKGPVLALQAYGSLTLRHAGDLDLLVEPGSVWEADRILADAGYVRTSPGFALSAGQAAVFTKIRKDFRYIHPDRAIHVELHWRWSQNAYLLPLRFEDIWRKAALVQIGDSSVAVLPREELVLYLCAHGAHAGWFRLKWLCDVAALIGDAAGLDVPRLVTRARDLGSIRMLAQGLVLAHEALDASLPASLSAVVRQARCVPRLVNVALKALVKDEQYWTERAPVSAMPAQFRYRLSLRANLRYKWHNIYIYSLWTDDWRLVRVAGRLLPLYFMLRPFLGLIRRVRLQRGIVKSRI